MKRHKEYLPPSLELTPIRLLGGFICLDAHIGCRGCKYCLNRRQPILDRILNLEFHTDIEEMGISLAEVIAFLHRLPSFSEARTPIRIGHLSDWHYQQNAVETLLAQLPADYPVVLMTRFPLSSLQVATVLRHSNVIAHVTLTPYMSHFDDDYLPPEKIIKSAAGLPREALTFMLRPLIAGNASETLRVIAQLPAGANVSFHQMNVDNIPSMPDISGFSATEALCYRQAAEQKQITVFPLFGCVLRRRLGLPFFKFAELARDRNMPCERCPNLSACQSLAAPTDAQIRPALMHLRLTPAQIQREKALIRIETNQPAARAEEIYLSELFCYPVEITTVKRSSQRGLAPLQENLIRRWAASGFYPVNLAEEMSEKIRRWLIKKDEG